VAEALLDLSQILSNVIQEDRRRAMTQPVRGNLPTPSALQAHWNRKLNARLENGAPEYPANTNCDPANASPSGQSNSLAFKGFLNLLPLKQRRAQGSGNRNVVEDATLPLNPQRHNFFSYCLAVSPPKLDQLIKPASGLKQRISQVERELRAIALLLSFQIVKEAPDVSEEQIPDLGSAPGKRSQT
jgi:hypothetical protein